jgi:hypothetical protein
MRLQARRGHLQVTRARSRAFSIHPPAIGGDSRIAPPSVFVPDEPVASIRVWRVGLLPISGPSAPGFEVAEPFISHPMENELAIESVREDQVAGRWVSAAWITIENTVVLLPQRPIATTASTILCNRVPTGCNPTVDLKPSVTFRLPAFGAPHKSRNCRRKALHVGGVR